MVEGNTTVKESVEIILELITNDKVPTPAPLTKIFVLENEPLDKVPAEIVLTYTPAHDDIILLFI